jgi:twitching motility protein PilT
MTTRKAELFSLKSGEIPHFHTGRSTLPVGSSPLSEERVLAYLRELAGPAERAALEAREAATFVYRDFTITAAFRDGGVEAEVRPAAAAPRAQTAMEFDRSFDPRAAGSPPIDELFRDVIGRKASDLHLTMGQQPRLRLDGRMVLTDLPPLTPARMAELLWPICSPKNRGEFERDSDTDFAYDLPGVARFRCNYFMDRTGMGAVFRQIPTKIPTMEQLGLPKEIIDLCWLSKGFVVVTGPTGSGKSTTLSALINHINENRSDHIITIEDPIEFVHQNKKCLINQREIGTHTQGFKRALRAALREDPDIVLVGEMRDLETIGIAIETAETGHLVFGTLHTTTAPSTVDRIIDQFPSDRQTQIRVMLSETLKGVIAQTLCRKIGGGRIAAYEVLIVNTAVSNLIREGKTFQIPSLMQTQRQAGMRTLNDSLLELVKAKTVDAKEAYIKAVDKGGLLALYERAGIRFDPERLATVSTQVF